MSLLRLYLDADVNPLLAAHLRVRGFDATSALELGRGGLTDQGQLELATREGRCLLTHNRDDFLELAIEWAERGIPHRGILLAGQWPLAILFRRVLWALALYSAEDVENPCLWVP